MTYFQSNPTEKEQEVGKNEKQKGGEHDGGGVGGHGVHLSPWIHQEDTFSHRSAWSISAESGQELLTSR